MRAIVVTLVVLLVLAVGYLGYAEHRFRKSEAETSAQIERLATSVNRLAILMEHLLRERGMADVNLTDGNASLDHAATAEWTSGSQTVQLTVYKNSANETSAEFRTRYADAVTKYMTTYPPNTN